MGLKTVPQFAPRQDRSRRTLERILAATERLLRDRPFARIAVADIVRLARASVGSFYARFPDKEALLPHLYARYDRDLHERVARLLAAGRRRKTLAALAEWFVAQSITAFRARRWLFHALALHARVRPESIDADTRRRRTALHRHMARLFTAHSAEIAHSDPLRAVEMGLFIVLAACRDKIIFGEAPHAQSLQASDRKLRRELTRFLLAYLRAPPMEPANETRNGVQNRARSASEEIAEPRAQRGGEASPRPRNRHKSRL